jgi:heme/copper-type cytochrome/quinol oxidase subunit 4
MKRDKVIAHIGAFALITVLHISFYAALIQSIGFIRLSDGNGQPIEKLLKTIFISWTACIVLLGIHWVVVSKPLRNQ